MDDDIQVFTTAISTLQIKNIRTARALAEEAEAAQSAYPQPGLPTVAPTMFPGTTYPTAQNPGQPYQQAQAMPQWPAVPATPWNPQAQWAAPVGAGGDPSRRA